MRLARLLLGLQAAIMAGLGAAYWLRPYEMANLNGMLLMEAASVSHLRVYYGGLQLGLALFLLWSMRRPERLRSGLVLVLLMQAALLVARLGAYWQDGSVLQGLDVTSLIYKAVAVLLSLWALRALPAPVADSAPDQVWGEDAPPPPRRRTVEQAAGPSGEPGE